MAKLTSDRLHALLQQLLLFQKNKHEVKTTLSAINFLLDDGCLSESLSDEECSSYIAAIFLAMRVGIGSSMVTGTWERDRVGYATVIHSCYKVVQSSRCSSLGRLVVFSNIYPILSGLLSNTNGDSVTLYALLQAVNDLCVFIQHRQLLKKEFIAIKHVGLYGKLISICLEVVSDPEKDFRCRELAMLSIEAVVQSSKENGDSLAVVLPGLATTLVNTACSSVNEHLFIVTSCLKVMSLAVCICLAKSEQDTENGSTLQELNSSIRELYVQRDEDWRRVTSENIRKMVRLLCSKLAVHRDEEVRRTLLESIYSIRHGCRDSFKDSLDGLLLDLLLTSQIDTSFSRAIIDEFRRENLSFFSLHMHEKLREVAERLPLHLQSGLTSSDILLHQLAGVISCLREYLNQLASSRSPTLRSVICALGMSLRINEKRLLICRGLETKTAVEFLKTMPLSFDVNICTLLPLCNSLARYGGIETVEFAFNEMLDSNECERASMAALVTLILAEMETPVESYTLLALVETCIDWLKEMKQAKCTSDETITHTINIPGQETVLKINLVLLATVAFTRITEQKKRLKLLIVFLYHILNLYSAPEWIVHDAADCALAQVASTMRLSVSELLYERGSFLVHQIALAARSSAGRDHAPIVLSALLDKVDDQRMFADVRHIVEDLLKALDASMQEYCFSILRSMLSFVSAVDRWFPELRPSEEEEAGTSNENIGSEEQAIMESAKPALPQPISSVESVLLRTKHLLSSPHLPIRLLTMRILHAGLHALRNFDDCLLPMVHQNWEALINRFSDDELEVRQEAIKIVAQMVAVSKSFVSRRVRLQLWPILEKWVTRDRFHTHSSGSVAYKLLLQTTKSVADICIGIEALPLEAQPILDLLELIRKQATADQMKSEADNASRQIQAYLAERRQ